MIWYSNLKVSQNPVFFQTSDKTNIPWNGWSSLKWRLPPALWRDSAPCGWATEGFQTPQHVALWMGALDMGFGGERGLGHLSSLLSGTQHPPQTKPLLTTSPFPNPTFPSLPSAQSSPSAGLLATPSPVSAPPANPGSMECIALCSLSAYWTTEYTAHKSDMSGKRLKGLLSSSLLAVTHDDRRLSHTTSTQRSAENAQQWQTLTEENENFRS